MKDYTKEKINRINYKNSYIPQLKKKEKIDYSNDSRFPSVIEELRSSPTKVTGLENKIYLMGSCGSCPSCACIESDLQALAVIEAPATVPLLVIVGGIKFSS